MKAISAFLQRKQRLLWLVAVALSLLTTACGKKKTPDRVPLEYKEANAVKDSMAMYERYRDYYYNDSTLKQLSATGQYKEAIRYMEKIEYQREGYFSIPYYLLAKANIFYAAHEYDSAKHYFKIAAHNIDRRVAAEAGRRLAMLELSKGHPEKAYELYRDYQRLLHLEVDRELQNGIYDEYQRTLLKSRLAEAEAARRTQELWIVALSAAILLSLALGYIFYILRRRRRQERERTMQQRLTQIEQQALQEETRSLAHENQLLRQAEELQKLREIQSSLRESLFRRMSVLDKIPSLHLDADADANSPQRILLTISDWEELRQGVDAAYSGFTRRLQRDFPELTHRDLNFCCLLKIGVSLQDLSDIYCISKTSISTKKFRLKREKFNLAEAEPTLDDFLQAY